MVRFRDFEFELKSDVELVINLQGDEPLMNIEDIQNLNNNMINTKRDLGTLAAKINDKKVKLYNCNDIIKSSEIDPIHWSKNTHHEFGRKFGEFIISSFKL